MRFDYTKEWCLNMARLEGASEIGAGTLARDPSFDAMPTTASQAIEETNFAFGRLVRLMRRSQGVTLEKLAEDADIEISELIEIEDDIRRKPELRTVHQLASYFGLPRSNLLKVAGLTAQKDEKLHHEAVRFAARSESIESLNKQERMALEAFVAVISGKT